MTGVFKDWLDLAGAPADAGLYFLGPGERRITFYSQQVRGLRTAHALLKTDKVRKGEDVAVVGAGAAGLTAAVALALGGAVVTLYDPTDEPLSLQSGSPRLLHPHIYEWPDLGSLDAVAGLPILDWTADTGDAVFKALQGAFATYDARLKTGLDFMGKSRLKALIREDDRWRVTFEPNGDPDPNACTRKFKTVILAMGFGEERVWGGAEPSRYWKSGSADTASLETDSGTHYLISGAGDGGLTDLMALLIRDFQHVDFAREVLAKIDGDRLAKAIDAACEGAVLDTDLEPAFRTHVRPVLSDYGVLDHLRLRVRTDRQVTMNSNRALFAHRRAARLNQLLAFAIMEAAAKAGNQVTSTPGAFAGITGDGANRTVTLTAAGASSVITVNKVICRHGPETKKLYKFAEDQFDRFRAHSDAAIAANGALAEPPSLHPETFAFFEELDIALLGGSAGTALRAAGVQRDSVVRISRDTATQALVQIGTFSIDDLADQCERLAAPITLLFEVDPDVFPEAREWTRLARASDGKLVLAADAQHFNAWQALDPKVVAGAAPSPKQRPCPLAAATLSEAIDDCLLRLLDIEVQACLSSQQTPELDEICPTIVGPAMAQWAHWRAALVADPTLKASFLRWLCSLEPANDHPWTGCHSELSVLGSTLILMLAVDQGETITPEHLLRGNLSFAKGGVAVGSGCKRIGGELVSNRIDPGQWDVDAVILGNVAELPLMSVSEGLLTAGDPAADLRMATRVRPAVFLNSVAWRNKLKAGIGPWRAAVADEFKQLRERQDKIIKAVTE